MKNLQNNMKEFFYKNWFRLSILLIVIIGISLYLNLRIKEHNYELLNDSTACNRHYVQLEWERCINSYMKFYIGEVPALKFPH